MEVCVCVFVCALSWVGNTSVTWSLFCAEDQSLYFWTVALTVALLIALTLLLSPQIAREHGIRFFETSAKANINIEKAFLTLAEDILRKVYVHFEHILWDWEIKSKCVFNHERYVLIH